MRPKKDLMMNKNHDIMTLFKEINSSLSSIDGRMINISTAHNASFLLMSSIAIGNKLYDTDNFSILCMIASSFTFINMVIIQRLHSQKMECIRSMQEIWKDITCNSAYKDVFPAWILKDSSGGSLGLSLTIITPLLVILTMTAIASEISPHGNQPNGMHRVFFFAIWVYTIRLYLKLFLGRYVRK